MQRTGKKTTVESNIKRVECRKTKEVKYEVKKFGRYKMLDTLEQARKYIDRVCIELGREQVYNTFKQI